MRLRGGRDIEVRNIVEGPEAVTVLFGRRIKRCPSVMPLHRKIGDLQGHTVQAGGVASLHDCPIPIRVTRIGAWHPRRRAFRT